MADSPAINIVAPAHEIGDLGAALGNVWNMDNLSDVAWSQPDAHNFYTQYTIASSIAGAYGTVLKGVTPQGSDLATAFYTNATVSIPGSRYHYLLYRSYVPTHLYGEGGTQLTNGRILYSAQWGSNWLVEALPYRRYSLPYLLCGYGEWCLYFFDLTQDINGFGSPNPWDWGQPGATIEAFGLWPHENWADYDGGPSGDSPDYFYLDYLYLTGEIVTTPPPDSTYTVRWNVADVGGGLITSTLYYQEQAELLPPGQSPTCDGTLAGWTAIPGAIQTLDVPVLPYRQFLPIMLKQGATSPPTNPGVIGSYNQSFTWSLQGGAYTVGKVYYVCVVAEDSSGNKSYRVSSAPVIKTPAFTTLSPEP